MADEVIVTPRGRRPLNLFAEMQKKNPQSIGSAQDLQQPVLKQTPTPTQAATEYNQFKPVKTMPAVNPNSDTSGMDALLSMYTSPEDELKMKRASMNNQRILAVADALRHIGNIYNTTNYAPAQQFNNPVLEARQRYQQDKALRDAANARYMTYQQAKAAQDAKQRQWEATFNYNAARDAAKLKAQQDWNDRQLKERARQFGLNYDLNVRKADDQAKDRERRFNEQKDYHNRSLGLSGARLGLEREKFEYRKTNGGGGRGSTKTPIPLNTPNGAIYPAGGKADANQLQQIYYKAKEIDQKHSGEKGYKPLVGGMFGLNGTDNYKQVTDALMRSGELADWAQQNLGWTYDNSASNWDNYAVDDDDYDEEDWEQYEY